MPASPLIDFLSVTPECEERVGCHEGPARASEEGGVASGSSSGSNSPPYKIFRRSLTRMPPALGGATLAATRDLSVAPRWAIDAFAWSLTDITLKKSGLEWLPH
jgi:hypothetical protein